MQEILNSTGNASNYTGNALFQMGNTIGNLLSEVYQAQPLWETYSSLQLHDVASDTEIVYLHFTRKQKILAPNSQHGNTNHNLCPQLSSNMTSFEAEEESIPRRFLCIQSC